MITSKMIFEKMRGNENFELVFEYKNTEEVFDISILTNQDYTTGYELTKKEVKQLAKFLKTEANKMKD
jgi:hypothetical protein